MNFSRAICSIIISLMNISISNMPMISYLEKCLPYLQALPFSLHVSVCLVLSLFATTQRTKEIGVRKVLGASVSNIVMLLSKDFIKLVIIAFIIASPVAWYIMHNWLQDFAYRINISWWIFIAAGLLAVIIALATISFQAIKAAIANPVKSLRTE